MFGRRQHQPGFEKGKSRWGCLVFEMDVACYVQRVDFGRNLSNGL